MLATLLVVEPSGSRRALAAVQTPERAAAAAPADLSAADVLPICDRALVAAIEGHDPRATVEEAVKGMPVDQQHAILGVCGIYLAGAVSMLKHVTPTVAPAGKSLSI